MDLENILKRLEGEGKKVLAFFKALGESDWDEMIYTEGDAWGVHQILAHFVSVERAFQWLTNDIVSGGRGTPAEFDLERFNHEQVAQLQPYTREELLKTFSEERSATIQQASGFTPEDLDKVGHHPWFGMVNVGKLLKLLYRHNQLHIRDIRHQLSPK